MIVINNNLEKNLNTISYSLIILVEVIYIYVNNNNLSEEDKNFLVKLGRKILLFTAIYYLVLAFIGLKKKKNIGQYKQVIASIFAFLAAFIRITIKDDDISFR